MKLWNKLTDDQKSVVKEIQNSFKDEVRKTHVKKTGFSASALGWSSGKCPRRWWLVFNGVDSVETLSSVQKKKMQIGTAMHDVIQNEFKNNPNLTVEIEREIWSQDPPLHGFIDAVVTSPAGEEIPVEIKSSAEQAMAYRETSFNSAAYHKLQLLIYLRITQTKLGLFLYENRDDFRDLIIPLFLDDDNQAYIDYLWQWMRDVWATYESEVIPNFFAGKRKNSKICGTCIFYKPCHEIGEVEGGIQLPLLELPK